MTPVILVADDDESYDVLLPHSLRKANMNATLHFVRDGNETIDYLTGKGAYSNREKYPVPHLLLLDLKMPRVNGFDVLEWRSKHPEFKSLPVIVWSSSDLAQDKAKAISLGAAYYVCKPADYHALAEIVHDLEKYFDTLS